MSTGETWTLGHRPALDGLRGIAVLMVVGAHASGRVVGSTFGIVGVGIFFALSGFLITSLLLEERARRGRVNLPAFYMRRARRLLPALAALLAVVAALGAATPTAVGATALYVSNWYRGTGADLGWLNHTWSLSVEEQFYLVWPLVVIAAASNRALLRIALAASGAAVVLRFWLYDPATGYEVYVWTHTRADSLLLGCALAVALHGRASAGRAWPHVATVGVVGLFGVALVGSDWSRTMLPTLTTLLALVVIYAATRGHYAGWLATSWLGLVGRRSYGLYLWHIPALSIALTVGAALGLPPAVGVLSGMAASWGAALLSWRYAEEPFLTRKTTAATSRLSSTSPVPDAASTAATSTGTLAGHA